MTTFLRQFKLRDGENVKVLRYRDAIQQWFVFQRKGYESITLDYPSPSMDVLQDRWDEQDRARNVSEESSGNLSPVPESEEDEIEELLRPMSLHTLPEPFPSSFTEDPM